MERFAILVTAATGPGILHQLTGVIARYQGDITSVEILPSLAETSRTYLEITAAESAEAMLTELGASPRRV